MVSPSQLQPTSLQLQSGLFTEKGQSWVEYCTSREQEPENNKEVASYTKAQLEAQINNSSCDRIERIESGERLREISESRGTNSINALTQTAPLLITRGLYDALIRSNRIFNNFQDFVLSFGRKKRELDIGPPCCLFEWNNVEDQDNSCPSNYPSFECAYGLRFVELNGNNTGKDPWSVRQTAFYHHYDHGKQTWILISPSQDFQSKMEDYVQRIGDSGDGYRLKNPFELHSIFITCAIANWRWYIKTLVDRATEQSSRVVAASVGKGKLSALIDFEINFEDRQLLKVVEDRVLDLFTIFDATSDTITTVLQEYELLKRNTEEQNPDRILSKLKHSLREVELYRKKVESLYKMVLGTASLLSNLLDYENAKIAEENAKALAILAQESRVENSAMRELTEKATEDAAAVKVITLITIVFLPTTVVAVGFQTKNT